MAKNLELRIKENNTFEDTDSLIYLRSHWDYVDGKPIDYTPAPHPHGNILSSGSIITSAAIASGDHLVIADHSDTNMMKTSSITFGDSTTTFLGNDGKWRTPSFTETDPVFTAWNKSDGISITKSQVSDFAHTHVKADITDFLHSHGNITSGGTIGTTSNLMVKTGANGILTAMSAGTTSEYLRGDGSWATPPNTNIYLTGISGSGNGTVTFTRNNLGNLTWNAYHTHPQDWRGIVDDLTSISTTESLSAKQGKVLKGYIDTINTLLLSDNSNLDTLQEIVDYIETNKATLDTLGISNITGLQNALNGKVDDSQVLTNVPAGAKFTDTTYSAMSVAEGQTATATTSRTMRADYLKNIILHHSPAGARPASGGTAASLTGLTASVAELNKLGGVGTLFHTGHKPQFSEVEGSVAHTQLPYASSAQRGAIRIELVGDTLKIYSE